MSASASAPPPSAIVTRLRAAGCVFAEDEARLLISSASTPAHLAAMVDLRAAGLPLEHVVGWAEFCGLRVAVDPGVFVPRRRSEFLVRQAAALAGRQAAALAGRQAAPLAARQAAPLAGGQAAALAARQDAALAGGQAAAASQAAAVLPDQAWAPAREVPAGPTGRAGRAGRPAVIVDLCCGSGALGAALAASLGRAELHAADIDPAAVRCARRNLLARGGRVYEGDLYRPLPSSLRGRVDILLANVPYVPTDAVRTLPPEARLHEAPLALDGGPDGLDVLRRVVAAAPSWLAPGGHLLTEASEHQALRAVEAFALGGLVARVVSSADLNATVVIGTRPARPACRDEPGR
jgi:release factor glutamine methyltransferase